MSAPVEGATDEAAEPAADRRADITADIDRARARVAASLSTLGEEVARRGDWRTWVRERPTLVLAGALALGFLLGGGGAPRSDR